MKFKVKAIHAAIAATTAMAAASSQATNHQPHRSGRRDGLAGGNGFQDRRELLGEACSPTMRPSIWASDSPRCHPTSSARPGVAAVDLSVATWENRVNATKSNSTIDQNIVLPGLTTGGVSGLTAGVNGTGNNDNNVTAVLNGTQQSSRVLYENTAVDQGSRRGGCLAQRSGRERHVQQHVCVRFRPDGRHHRGHLRLPGCRDPRNRPCAGLRLGRRLLRLLRVSEWARTRCPRLRPERHVHLQRARHVPLQRTGHARLPDRRHEVLLARWRQYGAVREPMSTGVYSMATVVKLRTGRTRRRARWATGSWTPPSASVRRAS